VSSGRNLVTIPADPGSVESLAISRGGGRIAAGGSKGAAWIWDAGSGQARPLATGENVTCIAFSPDGERVAFGGADRKLRVWDAQNRTLRLSAPTENGEVLSVSFSPDGARVLAGILGGVVQIRDAATGAAAGTLVGHAPLLGLPGVRQIAFTPDGTRILTAGDDSVRIWDAANFSGAAVLKTSRAETFITAMAASPDHRLVLAIDHSLHWFDSRTGSEIATVDSGPVSALAFSRDARLLAAGLLNGAIRVYDAATRTLVFTLTGHHARVSQVLFSPSGKQIVSSSLDKTVRLWGTDSRAMTNLIELSDQVNSIALSPDGSRLATGSGDLSFLHPHHGPTVRIWDAATGRIILDIDTSAGTKTSTAMLPQTQNEQLSGVSSVEFSPDCARILTVENLNPSVRIWDASSGALLRSFRLSGPAAFLSGGNRIVALAAGHLAVADASSGEPLLSLEHETTRFPPMYLIVDGNTLVVQDWRGPIRRWDATPSDEPEAVAYVQMLYNRFGFFDAVTASIRSNRTLSPSMTQTSLRLASALRDSFPEGHNRASWSIVHRPDASPPAYRQALEHAETACRLAPWNPDHFDTLGAARYRAGLYADAVDPLSQARRMRGSASVSNLAFTAMAQLHLGLRQEASATLRELQSEMSRLQSDDARIEGNTEDLSALVREAESVVSPAHSR
jgi:WD40 repeat protein